MAKNIALKDSVMVNSVPLSNFARAVTFSSEHERVDVSGFSATGVNEYQAGTTDQSVTVTFYGSYGASEVHATLWTIHQNRSIVPFEWYADQTQPVSATNPRLFGNVQLLTYGSPNRTRGEVDTFEATFTACDAAGLTFSSSPIALAAEEEETTAKKK
jgi:hypothetical protein